jgi:hypothetical protein
VVILICVDRIGSGKTLQVLSFTISFQRTTRARRRGSDGNICVYDHRIGIRTTSEMQLCTYKELNIYAVARDLEQYAE